MARPELRLPENAPGSFYVDRTCIDCDTCRRMAPATFGHSDTAGLSYVHAQPSSPEEVQRALIALVSCPTASIGSDRGDVRAAVAALPAPIAPDVTDVLECGFTSEKSFGAMSYLIRRPDGNVLVDSPRAATPLVHAVERLGGAKRMFLTHRDDVADHEEWRARTGCERVAHALDVRGVERLIEGREPVALAPDLLVIPTPGHTRGSACLLYKETFLFTGDHLWAEPAANGADELSMGRTVCWYSWPEQVKSLERLLDHRFEWVLPGHLRPYRAANSEAMRGAIERLIQRL